MPGDILAAMPQVLETNVLTYASGAHSTLSQRGWRVLFWVGALHLVALLTLIGVTSRGFLALHQFLHGKSLHDWFVMGILLSNATVPVLALANGIAVAGYWLGLHGRSPRRLFTVYTLVQLSFMVIDYAVAIPLVLYSPHRLSGGSSIGMSSMALVTIPLVYIIIALPLWLLLFTRIRRACFAA